MSMRTDGEILFDPYTDEEMMANMNENGEVVGYVSVDDIFIKEIELAGERELRGETAAAQDYEDELVYMVIPDTYAYVDMSWALSDLESDTSGETILEVTVTPDI